MFVVLVKMAADKVDKELQEFLAIEQQKQQFQSQVQFYLMFILVTNKFLLSLAYEYGLITFSMF